MSYLKPFLRLIFGKMLWLFQPDRMYESIHDIDFNELKELGISHILCDVDNTIMSYNEKTPSIQILNLFNRIKLMDVNIILFSNNSNVDRIGMVAKSLQLPGVAFSCKPFIFTAQRVMNDYDMRIDNTVVIGDQISTDVLLGNWLGCKSIVVDPISTENCSIFKKFQYFIEEKILEL